MNALTIIYIVGALAIGALAGMIIELGIDNDTIKALREANDRLTLENEALRSEAPHEVIEILDRRDVDVTNYLKPF